MIERERALAASREEAQQLAGQAISEVTPSRRDFALFVATQKQELAVVARMPGAHEPSATLRLVEHARACDAAEVAALAVATGPGGCTMNDLAAIANATSAPILRDAFTLHPTQLYFARLHGADAALLPVVDLETAALQELVVVASSLHMAAVVEAGNDADVAVALRFPHVVIGLRCTDGHGQLDVERTRQLAQRVPPQRAVIALAEVRSPAECAALRGCCDAVVVGEALEQSSDVTATLERLLGC